ncbi:uncharacterized protein STEHIDRAFT_121115 [Stereum hirsutum FP-91666 SS1]|uniref:uncharacterized protein n=1 Tax=Stereum hirsutum (strain FP-91666) TaxID=721885 RepID=UPI0004410151|nr:uncharacterized protein STEHIDRAFT_121115 [Stereum hirsutum FP-91666 SS1]EIM87500.1 hypothetical protein STEHIDRAFT_121115 [Stereum hirsutum FP-91666 SS1]
MMYMPRALANLTLLLLGASRAERPPEPPDDGPLCHSKSAKNSGNSETRRSAPVDSIVNSRRGET